MKSKIFKVKMGLRSSKCYKWDSPAYTRVAKNPQDSYITGIPGSKITRFNTGNLTGEFDTEISVISTEDIQVRHNSLEAARITVNRTLEEFIGTSNYHFKIRVYPHHILRENVMATGAGADRVQSGMRNAFGKPISSAARVHKGQQILTVYLNKTDERIVHAKKALRKAIKKLPGELAIEIKPRK